MGGQQAVHQHGEAPVARQRHQLPPVGSSLRPQRLLGLPPGGTTPSRSMMSTSAPISAALAKRSGRVPGVNSQLRVGFVLLGILDLHGTVNKTATTLVIRLKRSKTSCCTTVSLLTRT